MSLASKLWLKLTGFGRYMVDRPVLLVGSLVLIDVVGVYHYYKSNQPTLSKLVSKANRQIFYMKIPAVMREWVYRAYGNRYSVDFDDMVLPLERFETLGDFFTRHVKPRPIPADKQHLLVPADSRVLSITEVTADQCMIVKDIKYSLGEFITGQPITLAADEITALKRQPSNKLYQVIFYLAPGDYHRFHSPSDFEVVNANRIDGSLMSVNLASLEKFGGQIYQKNERVLLEGRYWNGYLNLAMVGAFNVGDISVREKNKFEMGQELGMFKLGSTIVMHFEAPPATKFNLQEGQKVRYGDVIY